MDFNFPGPSSKKGQSKQIKITMITDTNYHVQKESHVLELFSSMIHVTNNSFTILKSVIKSVFFFCCFFFFFFFSIHVHTGPTVSENVFHLISFLFGQIF